MFLAVPGRSPAWASPPKGEAGPGKAVLVATGFLWAGADRGRLLMLRSVCMQRDIVVGFVGAALRGVLAAPLLVTFINQRMALAGFAHHGEDASRRGALEIAEGDWRSLPHARSAVRHWQAYVQDASHRKHRCAAHAMQRKHAGIA